MATKSKQISYNDPTGRKDIVMEAWIGRHWKQILLACFILTGLSTCWGMYNISDLSSVVEKQSTAIKNLSTRVIVTTPDGRVSVIQTADVPTDSVLLILRDIIHKYLIYSAFEIQNTTNDPKQFAQIPKVKDFVQHFCSNQQCTNQFNGFINGVWKNYKEGKLPEMILLSPHASNSNSDVYSFSTQDRSFSLNTNVPIILYIVQDGKWVKQTSSLNFELVGYLDLQNHSTMKNPWGIRLTSLKATVPVVSQH